jgi:spore coat protein H
MKTKKIMNILVGIAILISVSCIPINSSNTDPEIQSKNDLNQTNVVKNAQLEDISLEETDNPEGWNEITHSKESDPNFDVVFPQDEVNRIDITISPESWETMLEDMTSNYGVFGVNQGGEQRGGQNRPEGGNQVPQGQGQRPAQNMGPAGEGMMESGVANPVWVPVTIQFDSDTWSNVGMRYKGNSSLKNSWQSGNLKLPFKLDFDEFEEVYPEIEDQRFYGFKQLTFSSNFKDASFLHEKVAADIFRDAGVPAAHTAFYEVYVDYGEGPIYFGLYTMVEVVDDTVIETQFDDDSGNVYKPSGKGATFAKGSFSEGSFDKETNQDEADYSDILAMYDALHAETRTTDPEVWRSGLEDIFDVSGFLNYLAVNSVIQNWDTYGIMTHNYYLYNDPNTELLTWIPWDNNEAMQSNSGKGTMSISLDEVNENWPLIRFLLDDPIYHAQYVDNVEKVINGAFYPETITARLQELHDLIEPYALSESNGYSNLSSEAAFEKSLAQLIQHVNLRFQEANKFISSF